VNFIKINGRTPTVFYKNWTVLFFYDNLHVLLLNKKIQWYKLYKFLHHINCITTLPSSKKKSVLKCHYHRDLALKHNKKVKVKRLFILVTDRTLGPKLIRKAGSPR